MVITINSKEQETQSSNLQELSVELQLPGKGVAVAVNNRMIPREQWSNLSLQENDKVVIIKAACGG